MQVSSWEIIESVVSVCFQYSPKVGPLYIGDGLLLGLRGLYTSLLLLSSKAHGSGCNPTIAWRTALRHAEDFAHRGKHRGRICLLRRRSDLLDVHRRHRGWWARNLRTCIYIYCMEVVLYTQYGYKLNVYTILVNNCIIYIIS